VECRLQHKPINIVTDVPSFDVFLAEPRFRLRPLLAFMMGRNEPALSNQSRSISGFKFTCLSGEAARASRNTCPTFLPLLRSCLPLLVSPVVNVLFPDPQPESGIYFNSATELWLDGYRGSRNNSDVEFNRQNGVAPQGGQYWSNTVSEEIFLSADQNPSLSVEATDPRKVTLTFPMRNHERGKDRAQVNTTEYSFSATKYQAWMNTQCSLR
jgi:hypothetical protein